MEQIRTTHISAVPQAKRIPSESIAVLLASKKGCSRSEMPTIRIFGFDLPHCIGSQGCADCTEHAQAQETAYSQLETLLKRLQWPDQEDGIESQGEIAKCAPGCKGGQLEDSISRRLRL